MGTRKVPFTREIFIDQEDFRLDPPSKYFRLSPGKEVRLRFAYVIRCEEVIFDTNGKVSELHCTYDQATRSGGKAEGRKVKGIIHWVSIQQSIPVEVRLYDRLFSNPEPGSGDPNGNFLSDLNPDSIETLKSCRVEPGLLKAKPVDVFQFERIGYFCVDSKDSSPEALVFNRTVTLRDTWLKLEQEHTGQT